MDSQAFARPLPTAAACRHLRWAGPRGSRWVPGWVGWAENPPPTHCPTGAERCGALTPPRCHLHPVRSQRGHECPQGGDAGDAGGGCPLWLPLRGLRLCPSEIPSSPPSSTVAPGASRAGGSAPGWPGSRRCRNPEALTMLWVFPPSEPLVRPHAFAISGCAGAQRPGTRTPAPLRLHSLAAATSPGLSPCPASLLPVVCVCPCSCQLGTAPAAADSTVPAPFLPPQPSAQVPPSTVTRLRAVAPTPAHTLPLEGHASLGARRHERRVGSPGHRRRVRDGYAGRTAKEGRRINAGSAPGRG